MRHVATVRVVLRSGGLSSLSDADTQFSISGDSRRFEDEPPTFDTIRYQLPEIRAEIAYRVHDLRSDEYYIGEIDLTEGSIIADISIYAGYALFSYNIISNYKGFHDSLEKISHQIDSVFSYRFRHYFLIDTSLHFIDFSPEIVKELIILRRSNFFLLISIIILSIAIFGFGSKSESKHEKIVPILADRLEKLETRYLNSYERFERQIEFSRLTIEQQTRSFDNTILQLQKELYHLRSTIHDININQDDKETSP